MCRLCLVGDLHLRAQTPRNRKDPDFLQTMLTKLSEINKIAKEFACDAVIQVGDFFDRPMPAIRTRIGTIEFLRKLDIPLFCIAGQHDLFGHSIDSLNHTEVSLLNMVGLLTLVGPKPTRFLNLSIYGASFGQSVPQPQPDGSLKVLVIHKMISPVPLYHGHNPTNPQAFLEKHKFDLIVCGDYHRPFIYTNASGRTICNPGAVPRLTISERNETPSVLIYDSNNPTKLERVFLKSAKPGEEVFNELSDDSSSNAEAMVASIIEQMQSRPVTADFYTNLQTYFNNHPVKPEVKEMIEQTMMELAELTK